jgi:hypothetical protein
MFAPLTSVGTVNSVQTRKAQGPAATPWGVTFLGRYSIPTQTTGEAASQPIGIKPWTTVSAGAGVGFSFVEDYDGFFNGNTQELVTRVCLGYGVGCSCLIS